MPQKARTKKKYIVISGYYGSNNAGDEAMLAAMLESFRSDKKLQDKIEISVISTHPEITEKTHHVVAISCLSFFQIFKTLIKSDALISGGGSLLQNVTSKRSLYYYLGIILLAKLLHKKVMLFAQGIGPIHGVLPRLLTRKIINKVDIITIRDATSREELSKLKIKITPTITADPVLSLSPVSLDKGKEILFKLNISPIKPLLCVSVRDFGNLHTYKEEIARGIALFARTYAFQIIFLPMQYPEDAKTAKEIIALLKKNSECFLLDRAYSTTEILSLIGNFSLVLSVRLHALIFASIMGVPLVGISYDPKIDRFLASLGEKPIADLQNIKSEQVFSQLEAKWFNRSAFKAKNKIHKKHLENLSLLNIKLLEKMLFEDEI